ncbi:hypothetical protein K469DRAFT_685568 [Zopfia rhizophila CBS 207.26]|uniref:MFS general substrate transporter n=1 Tax=Zopfia rhizophila CBS 207.26 TaxID=1314779 RepID=A0A6A6EAY4_9PEZI|nr:hypothetical protein K469DRAFT_685568 [Zopfia rhizophila CBS 207.26]
MSSRPRRETDSMIRVKFAFKTSLEQLRNGQNRKERALLKILDFRVLLPGCIVYVIAYLDRGNLGNVKILQSGTQYSLVNSLNLKRTEFNFSVSITYFAVTVGLLPSNIPMKKFSSKYYLSVIMLVWAIPVLCIAATKNAAGLMSLRFFLGFQTLGSSTALSERERFVAINRCGRGASRRTDVTWSWAAFIRIFTRPSTYVFFIAYIASCTVAQAQATFLPTILHTFLKYDITTSNIFSALTYVFIIPVTSSRDYNWIGPEIEWGIHHSDGGLHSRVCDLASLKSESNNSRHNYQRSHYLWHSIPWWALSICSASSLELPDFDSMYPNSNAPNFVPGFAGTVAILTVGVIVYSPLPLWLMYEANRKKMSAGFSIPLRAMEDEERGQVSAAAHARPPELAGQDANGKKDLEKGGAEAVGTC